MFLVPSLQHLPFQGRPFTPTLFDVHDTTLSMAYNLDGLIDFEAYLDPKVDLAYTKFMR